MITPLCPVHGQMSYVFTLYLWRCRGFDGEGCDRPEVTDEQLVREVA